MPDRYGLGSDEWTTILYLQHFTRFIDDMESPPQVTKKGISQMIDLEIPALEKVLKNLKWDGNIRSWSTVIKGEPKKKEVHFLTKEGERLARYIMDKARTTKVKVAEEPVETILDQENISATCEAPPEDEGEMDGPPEGARDRTPESKLTGLMGQRLPLLKVGNVMAGSPGLLELHMGLSQDGVLSLSEVRRAQSRCSYMRAPIDLVDFSVHVQECRRFYGRQGELARAEGFFESIDNQVLVIKGIDGIGKTSLASVITSMVRGDRHIFWYDFHNHSTLKHLLSSLASFLRKLKIVSLRNYLSYEDNPSIKEVVHLLEESLFDTQVLLVFEDTHRIEDDRMIAFLTSLKVALEGMMGMKMIVTGRTMVPFYDKRDTERTGLVSEIPLTGLDEEATRMMLMGEGVDDDLVNDLVEITGGHPMYVELVANLGPPSSRKSINFYIETELDQRLRPVERKTLHLLSVYRHPVPDRAILKRSSQFKDDVGEEPDHHILEDLKKKALLRSSPDGEYIYLHDMMRAHFRENMMPRARRSAHLIAARYYLEEKEDPNRIEALFHLVEADEHEEAAQFAVSKKREIFDTGYLGDVLELIHRIDKGLLPSPVLLDLTMLKTEILSRIGEREDAATSSRLASKMAGQLGEDRVRTRALFRLAENLMEMGMLDEAEECYMQGLDILEIEGDAGELARGHRGLGTVFWRRGALAEACEHFETALRESRKARDISRATNIVTELSECLVKRGDIGKVSVLLSENMRMVEASRDRLLLSRARSMEGLVRYLGEDWAGAVDSFQKAISAAKESGNSGLLARNLMDIALPMEHTGETERALEAIEEAEDIFMRIRDEAGLAQIELKRAELHELSKDLEAAEESYRKAIRMLERTGDRTDVSSAYCSMADLLKRRGKTEEAEEMRRRGMVFHDTS